MSDENQAPPTIEILSINDAEAKESSEPIVPHERMVIDSVIELWKQDPSTEDLGAGKLHAMVKKTHPNWQLSEKRVRTLLKKFGLMANQPQPTYAHEIKSQFTPDLQLPESGLVRLQMTKNRGKGLYAMRFIKKDTLIWSEEPFAYIGPLECIKLVKSGSACTLCGKMLASRMSSSLKSGLDCNICNELWCSIACKKADLLHPHLKHSAYLKGAASKKKSMVDSSKWQQLEQFCLENNWNALRSVAVIHALEINDKSGKFHNQFRAMASVSQLIRHTALQSSAGTFDKGDGGALFVKEQQEELMKRGHVIFSSCFPDSALSFQEFMEYMGTYNINNISNSLYLTQSHLNHDCEPNVRVEFGKNRIDPIKVYAKRDIRGGEELTTTYVNPANTVQQRRGELRLNWGFICGCKKCKSEIQAQEKRKSSFHNKQSSNSKESIKNMLQDHASNEGEFELSVPTELPVRRKSVRFSESVIAVGE